MTRRHSSINLEEMRLSQEILQALGIISMKIQFLPQIFAVLMSLSLSGCGDTNQSRVAPNGSSENSEVAAGSFTEIESFALVDPWIGDLD